jgi:hypothetical protein
MAITLVDAHGLVMILAWIFFGPMGILFARYGRSLRFGNRRQFLGKSLWFQIHRLFLTFTPLLTLMGFFFILVHAGGKWINPQLYGLHLFLHSIFGCTIVCCTIIQIWLALYRCHPRSRFRFLFDWSHRITGFLAFTLSIPTIFLIILVWPMHSSALITIISFWTGWIVIIIIIFEKIEYQQRAAIAPMNGRGDEPNQNNINANAPPDIESGTIANIGSRYSNLIKLILFFLHAIISTILAILLIILICN